MSDQNTKNKWQEVKNEIQKTWGLLTHDEIERAKGSLFSLTAALQKRYGMARHEAIERLTKFVDKLSKAESKSSFKSDQKQSNNSMDQNP